MKPCRLLTRALSAAISCVVGFTGCENRSANAPRTKAPSTATADHESKHLLDSALAIFANELNPDAYAAAISQLNLYLLKEPDAVAPMPAATRESIQRTFGPQAAAIASDKSFRTEDIDSLRADFLCRKIVQANSRGAQAPLPLASALFDWTVRHLALAPNDGEPPAPPASLALRGFGDSRDRAWFFCELLRQAQMHGMVIGVTTRQDPNAVVPWLCGAAVEGEVYLFDPWLGLAVPAPDEPRRPATLKELAADVSIATAAYPATADAPVSPADIDRLAILIPFDATKFSPRARFLESRLSGGERAMLTLDYDEVQRSVAKAWPQDKPPLSIQPWRYPFETIGKRGNRGASPDLFWPAKEHQARVTHILGDAKQARQSWVECDLAAAPILTALDDLRRLASFPIEFRRSLAGRSRSGIVYFGGVAQLDLGKMELARDWFDRYLADFAKPDLREQDIIEPAVFCRQLAGDFETMDAGFVKRLFECLSDPARKAVLKGAEEKRRAELKGPLTSEDKPRIVVYNLLEAPEFSLIVAEVNRALTRPDLVAAQSVPAMAATSKSRALEALARRADLSDKAIFWRNRLILDFVLRETVIPADRPWLASAVQNAALVRIPLGQRSEAIALLRDEYPTLVPYQSASLEALANFLEAH